MSNLELEPKSADEFYFQWHLTEKCNLRCSHCYHEDYDSSGELELESLRLICDKMDEAVRAWGKMGSLSLTGGEPFLRGPDLYALMLYVEQKAGLAYYDLLTNGTLIDGSVAAELACFPKLRRVQVSLEGPSAEVNDSVRGAGTFERIERCIRTLKESNIQVSVMLTLSRRNAGYLADTVEFLGGLGVDAFSVERFIPEGRGLGIQEEMLSPGELREAFETLYNLAMKVRRPRVLLYRPLFAQLDPENTTVGAMCSVGMNALTVMHDGTVYPCRRLPIPIGHALRDGFFKIWYDSDLLWRIRDPNNIKGKCQGCQYFAVCRGCRAMAYFVNDDYLAEDSQCWMSK